MVDFEAKLDGLQATAKEFRKIEEQFDGDGVTYLVGSGVKYGVFGIRN